MLLTRSVDISFSITFYHYKVWSSWMKIICHTHKWDTKRSIWVGIKMYNNHKELTRFDPNPKGNIFLYLFYLLIMLGKEYLVLLENLSRLMAEKWTEPFCTCKVGLMAGSQSRLQGRTPTWSAEIASPFPCGTGIQNVTQDRASAWHNKSRDRIILRAHP